MKLLAQAHTVISVNLELSCKFKGCANVPTGSGRILIFFFVSGTYLTMNSLDEEVMFFPGLEDCGYMSIVRLLKSPEEILQNRSNR